jgi:hypothetical protein
VHPSTSNGPTGNSLHKGHHSALNEVRLMIEARRLYSLSIGLTDAHLTASVFINASTLLWTRDKRLRKAAEGLGIHASLA